MKNFTFLKYLWAAIVLGLFQPALSQVSIEFDATDLGPGVKDEMFGANMVFVWSDFDQLAAVEGVTDFSVIRYPGGSVAESDLDLSDPSKYYSSGNNVPSKKSIGRYIQMVNQYNWTPVFVLPTIRFKTNPNAASAPIQSFVYNVLSGTYGVIGAGKTIHFEVGNEFYVGNALSSNEYGNIALKVIQGINQGIAQSGSNQSVKISVQSGRDPAMARDVANVFSGKQERNDIDFLVWHWYPGRTEIQLGLWQYFGVSIPLSQRLQTVRQEWINRAQVNKPFFFSEYNIRNTNNSNFDYGLKNPMGIMSIFAESIRGGAEMGTVWPLLSQAGNHIKTEYFSFSGSSLQKTTFNGQQYQWMEKDLRGTRIINGVQNYTYTNTNNFRQGIYAEAFASANKIVLFLYGTGQGQVQVPIRFHGFHINSRVAHRMYTNPGNENDPEATPYIQNLWPQIWSNRNTITLTLNKQSKYEVVKVVLNGYYTGPTPSFAKEPEPAEALELAEGITLYPNPVSEYFQVNRKDVQTVSVYSQSGQLVHRISSGERVGKISLVDVSKLKSGVYHVVVSYSDQKESRHVLIKD